MDRPANDTTTEARVVQEVYLIDPATKKPGFPGGGGGGGGDATEATQLEVLAAVEGVQAALEAPVDELPPEPLQATTGLTVTTIAKSATGDTALVAAVSGQTTRVHRMKFTCDAANLILIKRGSTTIDRFRFPASGGAAILEFSSYPWYVTGSNEALNINCSTTANVDGSVETVTSA